MIDDQHRAEAERAWEAYHDRHSTATELERLDLRDAFLAGDAAGYARTLDDLERWIVHQAELANSGTDQATGASYAALIARRVLLELRRGWHCPDPTHTRCQAKQEGAQE